MNQDLAIASHKLKSPIASSKSLVVIGINKKSNKQAKEIFKKIDEKLSVLNRRVDRFIEIVFFNQNKVNFLYEIFNFSELIKVLEKQPNIKLKGFEEQEILGDKKQLIRSLLAFSKLSSKEILLETSRSRKNLNIVFTFSTFLDKNLFKEDYSLDWKDEIIPSFLAKKIIELHGGRLKASKKKLFVYLPAKARKILH